MTEAKRTTAGTQPFLVEIGTEELPPKSLPRLAEDFHHLILRGLETAKLTLPNPHPEHGERYFSPRRLAVYVPAVLLRQPDFSEQRLGPNVSTAFDKNGEPTPAAEGFARSCGTSVALLTRQTTDKGERLAHVLTVKGKAAAELLPQIVNEALMKLPIPKRMRWGTGETQFVRPVHWVVILLGEKSLKGEILGVHIGNRTYGHRFLHPGAITLKHPGEYCKVLAQVGKVLVENSGGGLAKKISAQVTRAAQQLHGKVQLTPNLVQEVAALVEWPVPVVGGFDRKFLELPEEVIVAVLETQQRYFPLRNAKNKLLPHFVAVSNIPSKKPLEVKRGNERVIVPRLTDAMFFWDSDRKTRLDARIPELERVVFQKGLGSYGDKAQRVAQLAAQVAQQIGADSSLAYRAACLCKCDLVTGMVGEFPELQGIMGGYYARCDGEPEEVTRAISTHYRPRFAGDVLPESRTGQALAVADKLDTLAGIFAIGQKPTGDKDPFGLRRAGLGLMRILVEQELDVDLMQFVEAALAKQPQTEYREALAGELHEFLLERLRTYFLEAGIRADIFAAVRARGPHSPLDFLHRVQAVDDFLKLPAAISLTAANKRISNILKQADRIKTQTIVISNLREPAEKALHTRVEILRQDIRPLLASGNYVEALKRLAALRAPVDGFFDQVLVMDPDTEIRANRLALLAQLSDLFLHTADLALIQAE